MSLEQARAFKREASPFNCPCLKQSLVGSEFKQYLTVKRKQIKMK